MIQFEQQEKGLFTFYREQAKLEEQLQTIKKTQRKNLKAKNKNKNLSQIRTKRASITQKLQSVIEENTITPKIYQFNSKSIEKPKRDQMLIYNKRKNRHQRQQSIPRENTNSQRQQNGTLGLYSNGYYLKNKQFPFIPQQTYYLQRYQSNNPQIDTSINFKDAGQTNRQKKFINFKSLSKILKLNSHNSRTQRNHSQKLQEIYQYSQLPLIENKSRKSQHFQPKKYKSQKVQMALKSGDAEIVKRVRESLKEDIKNKNGLEQISYIDIGKQTQSNIVHTEQRQKNQKIIHLLQRFKNNY